MKTTAFKQSPLVKKWIVTPDHIYKEWIFTPDHIYIYVCRKMKNIYNCTIFFSTGRAVYSTSQNISKYVRPSITLCMHVRVDVCLVHATLTIAEEARNRCKVTRDTPNTVLRSPRLLDKAAMVPLKFSSR